MDRFAGSGTTAEAAILERFRVVVVESEPVYLPLIRQRVDRAHETVADQNRAPPPPLFTDTDTDNDPAVDDDGHRRGLSPTLFDSDAIAGHGCG